MILSFDTIIVRPPYTINEKILELLVFISEKIGEVNAVHLYRPPTELRKKNRIKTIQSSLEIEGNTLTEEQITALLDNRRVIAPKKDILEVQNAIMVYDRLKEFDPCNLKDLEKAHSILMKGLVLNPGSLRTKNVGIEKGSQIEHLAPNGANVKGLIKDLLTYLKKDKEIILIKSCVFHYEFEFIHPFMDGNGRMGRLWQTLILIQQYPVFEFLPIESLIKQKQGEYYRKLSESDKKGNSTPFIEFMLGIIAEALRNLLLSQNQTLHVKDRISLFREKTGNNKFTRKDYLQHFKSISAPTASRDLKWAVDQNILKKFGEQRLSTYKFVK